MQSHGGVKQEGRKCGWDEARQTGDRGMKHAVSEVGSLSLLAWAAWPHILLICLPILHPPSSIFHRPWSMVYPYPILHRQPSILFICSPTIPHPASLFQPTHPHPHVFSSPVSHPFAHFVLSSHPHIALGACRSHPKTLPLRPSTSCLSSLSQPGEQP